MEEDNNLAKQPCMEGESSERGAQNTLSKTVENGDIECPTGIPTMVNTPLFGNETENINTRMKSEQVNHVSPNVFETSVGKTEPDLEKYFPSTAWQKNNSS